MLLELQLFLIASIGIVYSSNVDFSWAPSSSNIVSVPKWTAYFKALPNISVSDSDDIKSCTNKTKTGWAATFDDGPSNFTNIVLDYLKSKRMKATFWVMGSRIMEYPEVLLDAYQAGHEIGIHTFTHPHLPSLNDDQIIAELILTARAIYEVIGEYPRFFRPPFGDIDDRVRNLAKSMGLTAVLWDADSQDWDNVNNTTMSKIPGIFKAWMEKGMNYSISLEHDYWQDTASIAVDCMNILIDSGMIIIPLSECIGVSSVYNNNILQTFFESEIFTDRPKTHPSTRNTASSLVSSSTSFATSTTSNPTTTASVNVQAPQLKSSSVLSQASVIGVLIATMFFLFVFPMNTIL